MKIVISWIFETRALVGAGAQRIIRGRVGSQQANRAVQAPSFDAADESPAKASPAILESSFQPARSP